MRSVTVRQAPEEFGTTALAAAGVELKDMAKVSPACAWVVVALKWSVLCGVYVSRDVQVVSHAMSAPGMEERLGEQLLRNLVWIVRAMQQQDAGSCAPALARIARAGRLHFGAVVNSTRLSFACSFTINHLHP